MIKYINDVTKDFDLTYGGKRARDALRIRNLYKQGHEIEYSNKNNWIKIGGECFNGFSREDVAKITQGARQEQPV